MATFAKNKPLTEPELDHLGQFLKNCEGGKTMNIEELDGYFAALIAGPEIVAPSEYMPEVFGRETHQFESIEEANKILGLMMRHWNDIAGRLSKGNVYLPLLLFDESGVEHGNDWSRGFIRGIRMRHDAWAELLADDDHGGCVIPMMMLNHFGASKRFRLRALATNNPDLEAEGQGEKIGGKIQKKIGQVEKVLGK